MARALVSSLMTRTKQNFQIAHKIAAMVESVEKLEDRFEVAMTPELVPQSPDMRYLPVGKENVAIKSVLSVEKTDQNILISLKFDAYVLERSSMSRSGQLVSRMASHLNSKIRINLRHTIEAETAGAKVVARRRLAKAIPRDCAV